MIYVLLYRLAENRFIDKNEAKNRFVILHVHKWVSVDTSRSMTFSREDFRFMYINIYFIYSNLN